MIHVLVVEDENRLRADLVDYLSMRGHFATGVASAASFREALRDETPDVIVMDVELPDGNGFSLLEELRKTSECGVIMLTAHGDAESRIRGYESGADIYLVKHSPLKEIDAAIRRLARRIRMPVSAGSPMSSQAWSLDLRGWTLRSPAGQAIQLTASELAFLNQVMRQNGNPSTRQKLATAVARPQTSFDDRHLDAVVSRLRKKIETETGGKSPIRAAYGVGYAFSAPATIIEA